MISKMQRAFLCMAVAALSLTAAKVFSSRSVSHIFPVSNFQVDHLHEQSDFTGGVLPNGVHQPFPDLIKVSFDVPELEKSWTFTLSAAKDLVSAETTVEVHNADGTVTQHPHKLLTYTSGSNEDGDMVTATIFGDNFASITYLSGSRSLAFQVLPAGHHEDEMEPEHFAELKNSLENGLVFHQITQDDAESDVANGQTDVARRLLQRFPTVADRWVGCNGGSATDEYIMTVGFALDTGFMNTVRRATGADPMAFVQQIVATSNMVYRPEFGVILQIGETVVKTAVDNDNWNQDRAGARSCAIDIQTTLDNLNRWRVTTRSTSSMGLWQLMTDCYPPPGTVGIAYIGTICNARGNNVGVNTYSGPRTWLTVAHEIGHNFGGAHSFELGQGRTGGIMDYADGTLNGVYTFNRRFREADMCPTIRRARQNVRGLTAGCLAPATGAPATTTAAPVTTAAPAATWVTGQFGACSAPCGNAGIQTRSIRCVQGTQTVSDTLCNAATRPAAQQPCNRVACTNPPATTAAPASTTAAPRTCNCGPFGAFSACVNGVQTRTRTCTPRDFCASVGQLEAQTQACTVPGTVPQNRQVQLRLNVPLANVDLNLLTQTLQAQLPRLIGQPTSRVTITSITQAPGSQTDIIVTFFVTAPLMQDVYTMNSAFAEVETKTFTEAEMTIHPDIILKNIQDEIAFMDLDGQVDHIAGARIVGVARAAQDNAIADVAKIAGYGAIAAAGAFVVVAVVAAALFARSRKTRPVVKAAATESFIAMSTVSERAGAI